MSEPIDVWCLDGYEVDGSKIEVSVYKALGKVRKDKGVWVDVFFKFRRAFKIGLKNVVAYTPRPAYVFYPGNSIECFARVGVFSNSIWFATVPSYMEPDIWYVVRVGWGAERRWVYDELLMWVEIDEEKMMKAFSSNVGYDIHIRAREFYKQVVMAIMFHKNFEEFRKVGGDTVLEPLRGVLDFFEFLEVADA
jgi:hypothetical protein